MTAEDLIRDARAASTPEELSDILLEALGIWHAAFWLLADVCAAAVEGRPRAFLAEAARRGGRSHQCLYRWADWACRVPAPTRSLHRSPVSQAREHGYGA